MRTRRLQVMAPITAAGSIASRGFISPSYLSMDASCSLDRQIGAGLEALH
jgi:hypothetical protein